MSEVKRYEFEGEERRQLGKKIEKEIFINPRFSLKQKTLLMLIEAYKGTITVEEIKKVCSDRDSSITSGLKELEEDKAIEKIRIRDKETGRWLPTKYKVIIYDEDKKDSSLAEDKPL